MFYFGIQYFFKSACDFTTQAPRWNRGSETCCLHAFVLLYNAIKVKSDWTDDWFLDMWFVSLSVGFYFFRWTNLPIIRNAFLEDGVCACVSGNIKILKICSSWEKNVPFCLQFFFFAWNSTPTERLIEKNHAYTSMLKDEDEWDGFSCEGLFVPVMVWRGTDFFDFAFTSSWFLQFRIHSRQEVLHERKGFCSTSLGFDVTAQQILRQLPCIKSWLSNALSSLTRVEIVALSDFSFSNHRFLYSSPFLFRLGLCLFWSSLHSSMRETRHFRGGWMRERELCCGWWTEISLFLLFWAAKQRVFVRQRKNRVKWRYSFDGCVSNERGVSWGPPKSQTLFKKEREREEKNMMHFLLSFFTFCSNLKVSKVSRMASGSDG